MASQPKLASLFHPKKPKKDAVSPTKPVVRARPRPEATPAAKDEEFELPDMPFQEFKLMSSALNGWKYDVMKFDSRKPVDLTHWRGPIKLNRKDLRREDAVTEQVPITHMLGPDGKPVIGSDGRIVMVDAEGKPIHADNGKAKQTAAAGKKKFQKKTRQVYVVPDEVRQLRREERYPWVIEDATGSETWTAQLEDITKSTTHAFFMPAANNIFKFVPANRWYKFQKKLMIDKRNTDTASIEDLYSKRNKIKPEDMLKKLTKKEPSSETAAMFKAVQEGRALAGSSTLVHSAGHSLGPGGRRLKAVDSGMNDLFGDDDEDGGAKRRREKEFGGEGDLDEVVYEEDFADDDEKIGLEAEDEETKDMEERLKKEYKSANKQRDGHIDESDDEDMPGMTKQAKAMQKLIRAREGNDAYDSDEEKNPYASSEEEEDEEVPIQPVILNPPVPPQPAPDSRQGSQAPGSQPQPTSPPLGSSTSRAASPSVPNGLNGHSIVAKRATSPKIPKVKVGGSRSGSPLASSSRAASPDANSRATSPSLNGNKKRKVEDYAGSPSPTSPNGQNGLPKPKKRKTQNNGAAPVGDLQDSMVVDWLRNTNQPTTRDCIQHFQPYLTDNAKKQRFTALIKQVAVLKEGVLMLKT
ncbi:Transcription initiation factor [Mycena indigotica]|uniref:Transcription initiation factor IIF subunit alpha n=1 Tax=Mycena indigotica TaxID=2126181 RepID=A0A8H6SME1_9AGAR|nr:Transcription initiation factor [Mycena indigotica]KAF7301703.1 Transcription initiation factor [Mycena indigotica]